MTHLKTGSDGKTYLYLYRMSFHDAYQEFIERFKDWNRLSFMNLPFSPRPDVVHHDVRKPLPYPDACLDVVYCYHILEHLTYAEAPQFVREIKRILKPGGICRFTTPDLALKARCYLEAYTNYKNNPDEQHRKRYEWAKLSAFEQTYRETMGGELLQKIERRDYELAQTIAMNGDLVDLIERLKAGRKSLKERWQQSRLRAFGREVFNVVLRKIWMKAVGQQTILDKLHERELWYYDAVSLPLLMQKVGFSEIVLCGYQTSLIPHWEILQLDSSVLGDHEMEPGVYVDVRK